ncbi:MAG: hypothetical protein KDK70_30805 [Myxococcales bacterium]|nr:hypothetical protein [Myxococcales bacterium]
MRHDQSPRQRSRTLRLLLGRPVHSSYRSHVLDDDLLGSEWRWDADDTAHAPCR